MPGPYIDDSHYVYGRPLHQPYPSYYNCSWYHRKPPRRYLSDMLWFLDDGSSYIIDNKPSDPRERINRSLKNINIVNIETVAIHSLRIKLYAYSEKDDIDLILEIGKVYDVLYVTEGGLKVAHGVLKLIDSTIPDICTRYIGEFNSTVNTAWIALDCSKPGKSDKRKIYIASIRSIKEVTDEDYKPIELDNSDLNNSQKLDAILDLLPSMNDKLDQIIIDLAQHDANIKEKLDNMNPVEKLDYIIKSLNNLPCNPIKDEEEYKEPDDSLLDENQDPEVIILSHNDSTKEISIPIE